MSVHTKAVIVRGPAGPVDDAIVRLNCNDACGPRWGRTNGDGYVAFDGFPDSVGPCDVFVRAPRFKDYAQGLTLAPRNQSVVLGGSSDPDDVSLPLLTPGLPPRPAPVPRAPLPPLPQGTYDRELAFTPPDGPDLLFPRGNFCGVRVPGVPILPGMAGYTLTPRPDPPLVMALDVFKYDSVDAQNAILTKHAEDSYTHYQLSIGHAIAEGWTVDRFVDLCARTKAIVGFADVWFLGGGPWTWDRSDAATEVNRDRDRAYWEPIVRPWVDALLSNDVIDAACVGWQLDGFNAVGDPILSIIEMFADLLGPHDVPIGTHWMNEAGGWWQTGGSPAHPGVVDRRSWWRAMRNKVLWFNHQGETAHILDPDMGVPLYQSKLVDTLRIFGDGEVGTSGLFGDRPFGLVVYECSGQAQFDDPGRVSEDLGDLRGYLLCCTHAPGDLPIPYGNGARRPDGTPL